MNITPAMEELASALRTVSGLRVYSNDETRFTPPAALVSLPSGDYDQTYGRGEDKATLNITVLISQLGGGRISQMAATPYADGSGPKSVKRALERHEYTSCDWVRVRRYEFARIKFDDAMYLGVIFTVDIAGQGG